MSEPEVLEAKRVYYHDCPALGSQTVVIEATLSNKEATFVLGTQHKCPFCFYEADEFKPCPGVTVLGGGKYHVDPSRAIKMQPADQPV